MSQPANYTVRVDIPQPNQPVFYTTGEAAQMLGISSDPLRWRIKIGKYPTPP